MNTSSLDEFEIRLAYQDEALNQLSEVVYAQSRELAQLAERCRELESRVQALAEGKDSNTDEAPPHY